MAIVTGDYVIDALAADGERVAIKIKNAIETGDYVIAALAADGELVACALDPIDTTGDYGIRALAADGEWCGLKAIDCYDACAGLSLTVVCSGFSGTDPNGQDWSTINRTWNMGAMAGPSCQGVDYYPTIYQFGMIASYSVGSKLWTIVVGSYPGPDSVTYSRSACGDEPVGVFSYASQVRATGVTMGTIEVTGAS